jgi:predicted PurR-regulated permease PerM
MKDQITYKERFQKSFVLVMVITYGLGFIALIGGFLEALLLAAVFSGILYPLYLWFQRVSGGRNALSSILTLLVSLMVIIVPLLFLLGLVAEQAIGVTEMVRPWIERHIDSSTINNLTLPEWVPFVDKLAPYTDEISAKIAEIAGKTGMIFASNLARVTEGAAVFFLNLFVMLYAMYFFLIKGPTLMNKILSYVPLMKFDKQKMIEVGLSVSRATVKGTLMIGIVQGMLGSIGFAVAGIASSVFWGAVMAILSVLPGIGAMLVWVPAIAYLLITGNSIAGIGLFVWCAVVVSTADNFLRPVLVGRDAQMPDLLILLSTLGGLALFGASGLVLGPILAALFMAVLTIYSTVFADWLELDQVPKEIASGERNEQPISSPQNGD